MKKITVGLGSGVGNGLFMLPTLKALKTLGYSITLYVQQDYDTSRLWKRCAYVDEVLTPPKKVEGELICGMWRPADWTHRRDVDQAPMLPPYRVPEWQSNLRLAEKRGWLGGKPDISDWCKNLNKRDTYDVGIVPGCKGGTWIRKRWSGMREVAEHFIIQFARVAVFGLPADGTAGISGTLIDYPLHELPDILASCKVIVGTDSGLTHLASALGVPVLTVFTASHEIKGQPMGPHQIFTADVSCRPCVSSPKWHACNIWMCNRIEPKAVIKAAEKYVNMGNGQ